MAQRGAAEAADAAMADGCLYSSVARVRIRLGLAQPLAQYPGMRRAGRVALECRGCRRDYPVNVWTSLGRMWRGGPIRPGPRPVFQKCLPTPSKGCLLPTHRPLYPGCGPLGFPPVTRAAFWLWRTGLPWPQIGRRGERRAPGGGSACDGAEKGRDGARLGRSAVGWSLDLHPIFLPRGAVGSV